MLSAAVAVDWVIQVAGFTHPAPRSCLGSLWRYLARPENDGKAYAKKAPLGERPGRGTSEDGWRRAQPSSPTEQRRRRSGFWSSRCSRLSCSSSSSHPKSEQGCAEPYRVAFFGKRCLIPADPGLVRSFSSLFPPDTSALRVSPDSGFSLPSRERFYLD